MCIGSSVHELVDVRPADVTFWAIIQVNLYRRHTDVVVVVINQQKSVTYSTS